MPRDDRPEAALEEIDVEAPADAPGAVDRELVSRDLLAEPDALLRE